MTTSNADGAHDRPLRIRSRDGSGIMGSVLGFGATVFKRETGRRIVEHADLPVVSMSLATSAAAIDFPTHTIAGRETFIDSGLWANCLAIVGRRSGRSRYGGSSL